MDTNNKIGETGLKALLDHMDNHNVKQYTFPVFRFGCVLLSDTDIPIDKSKKAALIVDRDFENYGHGLTEAIIDSLNSKITKPQCGDIRWRTRSGYLARDDDDKQIADFPLIEFAFKGFVCDLRACLTLCRSSRKSKVWYRVNCTGFNGKPAVNISEKTMLSFFKSMNSAKEAILESVLAKYTDNLAEAGVTSIFLPFKASFYASNLEGDFYGLPTDLTGMAPLADQFADSIFDLSGLKAESLRHSKYSKRVLGKYKIKVNSKKLSLIDCLLTSHVFEYGVSNDERAFVMLCPEGIDYIRAAIIKQNSHIQIEEELFGDDEQVVKLCSAMAASEASRHLLLEFGSTY